MFSLLGTIWNCIPDQGHFHFTGYWYKIQVWMLFHIRIALYDVVSSKTYINQVHANSHASTIFIPSLVAVSNSIDQLAGIISSQLRTSRAKFTCTQYTQSALKCELRLRQELELQFIGICYHSPCHVTPYAKLRMIQRKNLIQLGPLNHSRRNGRRRCIHTKDIQVCFSIENNWCNDK